VLSSRIKSFVLTRYTIKNKLSGGATDKNKLIIIVTTGDFDFLIESGITIIEEKTIHPIMKKL